MLHYHDYALDETTLVTRYVVLDELAGLVSDFAHFPRASHFTCQFEHLPNLRLMRHFPVP